MSSIIVPLLLLISTLLCATQEFSLEIMKQHLTQENPYIYSALGKKNVSQEQLNYTLGQYDTKIVAKYDEKDYPSTYGTYYDIGIEKPTESGIDFSLAYRHADGTQEYNNIKTGENGEFIVGAKIPLISLLNRIDQRRLSVGLAKMNLQKTDFEYKEAMRSFYFTLMSNYYTLLYDKGVLKLSEEILEKMEKRKDFLKKSVEQGNLPKVTLLEASQQIINAKQSYISAKRACENRIIGFIKYLNLSKEEFERLYHLPSLPNVQQEYFNIDDAFTSALKHRGDIQVLNTEIEKLHLENKNNKRAQYPEFNVGLYGLYDANEESGFKVSLDMSFPVEQNQYRGKNAEIKESLKLVSNAKSLQLLEIKTDLLNVINSLHTLVENILSSQEEIVLLLELEKFEKRKYLLGSSTLFLLNQRETLTIKAQKKVLRYKLEYQLLYQSYKRIISLHSLED